MLYNQQRATTTELCLTESSNGNFCAEKQINTIITYDWFGTVYLIGKIILGIITVYAIANYRKRKIWSSRQV
ncbi:MAG: hypothetical protein WC453_02140 [Patescibacteria group bacterium]